MVSKSPTLQEVKNTFFNPNGGTDFKTQLKAFVDKFGLNSEDIRNLSISALLVKMINSTSDEATRVNLKNLSNLATSIGVSDRTIEMLEK